MRKFTTLFLFVSIFSTAQQTIAQCGSNVLTKADFESPVQPAIGNNLTGLFSWGGWTMTGGPFNVIRTNGSAYVGGPDNAQNGTQYIDITSAGGTLYQDFTVTGVTLPVAFGGYFSSREQSGYTNWTASIDIIDLGSSTVVSTSSTRLFTIADGAVPDQEIWHYLSGNTTLPPGNYRFQANMGNYGNFDAAIVSLNCLLATRITSFSGRHSNGNSILNWKCKPSNDMSHFEIERSADGIHFKKIGTEVFSGSLQHEFADNSGLLSDKNYYRLKMVDKSGKFTYSTIIIIKTKGNFVLELSPNPVQNQLRINGLKGNGQISIFDMSGRRVFNQSVAMAQTVVLDVSKLNKGLYVMEYSDGVQTEVQKFNKQ